MARRAINEDFKRSTVKLVTEQGYTLAQAARSVGVHPGSVRRWRERFAPAAASGGAGADAGADAELARLRRENERLRMEREILKKATAFFARNQP